MFQKVLASFCVLFALTAPAVAQNPPLPDTSSEWMVHDEDGPTRFKITVTFCYPDFNLGCWVYGTACIDTKTWLVAGEGLLLVPLEGDNTVFDAWSDDSGLWRQWVWDTDHYDKVGGSPAVRSYHPL